MDYLSLDDALHIHGEQLRPQTGYYADLVEQAAALWESLAMNHGFVDANKRVAFACMDVFLGLNGARLEADPAGVVASIHRHLEAGTFRKPILDEWLRLYVKTGE